MATLMHKNEKSNLSVKNARLYEDDGKYYLDLRYLVEDECRVTEYHVPKVELPLYNAELCMTESDYPSILGDRVCLTLPDRELRVHRAIASFEEDGQILCHSMVYFARKVVEEKTKDMTIEEIEKKLGHKVRIVDSH